MAEGSQGAEPVAAMASHLSPPWGGPKGGEPVRPVIAQPNGLPS